MRGIKVRLFRENVPIQSYSLSPKIPLDSNVGFFSGQKIHSVLKNTEVPIFIHNTSIVTIKKKRGSDQFMWGCISEGRIFEHTVSNINIKSYFDSQNRLRKYLR